MRPYEAQAGVSGVIHSDSVLPDMVICTCAFGPLYDLIYGTSWVLLVIFEDQY